MLTAWISTSDATAPTPSATLVPTLPCPVRSLALAWDAVGGVHPSAVGGVHPSEAAATEVATAPSEAGYGSAPGMLARRSSCSGAESATRYSAGSSAWGVGVGVGGWVGGGGGERG